MQSAPDPYWQRVSFVAAAVAFTLCYAPELVALVRVWSTSSVYSFGFIVPVISLYVIWSSEQSLAAVPREPDLRWGVPITILAAAMLLAGRLSSISTLHLLSLVVGLAGLILLVFGREMWRRLWFPVSYLTLMLPIWDVPIRHLQGHSQAISAAAATALLRLSGAPALLDGTFIVLPANTLEVLPECSGINQLVSIIAMTLPAAYIGLRSNTGRAALLLMAPVVALFSNSLRIAIVGLLAENGLGSGDIRSVHLLEGLVVAVAGYAVILGCLHALSKIEARRLRPTDSSQRVQAPRPQRMRSRTAVLRFASIGILMASGVYALGFRARDVRLSQSLESFPHAIGAWALGDAGAKESTLLFGGVDDELSRVYQNRSGQRVRLSIGYQRYQHEGKELTGNGSDPPTALPGFSTVTLEPEHIELKQFATRNEGRQGGFLFWYGVNGRFVANDYSVKAYTLWNALTQRRTNGAVFAVAWECPAVADCSSSRESVVGFVRALLPLLPRYIPS